MRGDHHGPRIELRVTCDGCTHLDADHSYNAEIEENEVDWFCKAHRTAEFRADLPSGCCETPKWCPLYPSVSEKLNAAIAAK